MPPLMETRINYLDRVILKYNSLMNYVTGCCGSILAAAAFSKAAPQHENGGMR